VAALPPALPQGLNRPVDPADLPFVAEPGETRGEMLYRKLARTGEMVSAIGMGGFHLGKKKLTDDDAVRLIHQAVDRGITFMDNCWDYGINGLCEIRMGNALRDGYRQKAFLMTKIDGRTKQVAAQQLDESLRRLQTDHLDLLQFHEVIRMNDPERIFAEGGGMEAALAHLGLGTLAGKTVAVQGLGHVGERRHHEKHPRHRAQTDRQEHDDDKATDQREQDRLALVGLRVVNDLFKRPQVELQVFHLRTKKLQEVRIRCFLVVLHAAHRLRQAHAEGPLPGMGAGFFVGTGQ